MQGDTNQGGIQMLRLRHDGFDWQILMGNQSRRSIERRDQHNLVMIVITRQRSIGQIAVLAAAPEQTASLLRIRRTSVEPCRLLYPSRPTCHRHGGMMVRAVPASGAAALPSFQQTQAREYLESGGRVDVRERTVSTRRFVYRKHVRVRHSATHRSCGRAPRCFPSAPGWVD